MKRGKKDQRNNERLHSRPAIELKGEGQPAPPVCRLAPCFSGRENSSAKFEAVQGESRDPSLSAHAVKRGSSKLRIPEPYKFLKLMPGEHSH